MLRHTLGTSFAVAIVALGALIGAFQALAKGTGDDVHSTALGVVAVSMIVLSLCCALAVPAYRRAHSV